MAVNNGRNGYREPLFLGRPANIAAKLASNNNAVGIYLSNEAREAIELDEFDLPAKVRLTGDEVAQSEDCPAHLPVFTVSSRSF